MAYFVAYDTRGVIAFAGSVPDDQLVHQVFTGLTTLEGQGAQGTHYVLDGAIVAYTDAERAAQAALPQGWAWSMPARVAVDLRTLDTVREQAWTRIKAARTAAENAGFTYAGAVFDSDPVSVRRITGAVLLASIANAVGAPYAQEWTLADNTNMPLDGPAMVGVGVALGTAQSAIFTQARDLRATIAAATDVAALDALAWSN